MFCYGLFPVPFGLDVKLVIRCRSRYSVEAILLRKLIFEWKLFCRREVCFQIGDGFGFEVAFSFVFRIFEIIRSLVRITYPILSTYSISPLGSISPLLSSSFPPFLSSLLFIHSFQLFSWSFLRFLFLMVFLVFRFIVEFALACFLQCFLIFRWRS